MLAVPAAVALPGTAGAGARATYVVVYSGSAEAGRAALATLGATVEAENTEIGVATVTSTDAEFIAKAAKQPALVGAAADEPIGYAPEPGAAGASGVGGVSAIAKEKADSRAGGAIAPERGRPGSGDEPLASLQWDMRMIGATPTGSYRQQPGSKKVLVGVIDTGIDGSHPDIAPNFSKGLSRNFVTDIPVDPVSGEEMDGPCEYDSCVDPVDHDDEGHGTHVASTIASPINGLGLAGVAPGVTLVNIRAGQDAGWFFLQPTVDAITYAGDAGIDVVNMSFYTDPWLFNCTANPADSPEAQAEQRTIIEATQRAVRYATLRGVTLIAAAGNEVLDTGKPEIDEISPDYPYPESQSGAYEREIDNSCLSMPSEARGVFDVNAVGPSGRLSYYSNYGVEQTVVAAPGGDAYDGSATRDAAKLILAAYPRNVAEANGDIDANGNPTTPYVVRDDSLGVTSYYQYLEGTSMAAPHATGVAAIIISQLGRPDLRGGITANPLLVSAALVTTATATACPATNPYVYARPLTADYTKLCEGDKLFNGFYGYGIVNAKAAAQLGR
ncbi:S8 family serine peptidase [Frankia sp. CN6]|uniref:S8 family serine peptidase n=1 Tax=Frankia nepalensis TaxID=1836974 RepID=A0A937REM3_9ACTN|nr:S8 family serine peptidase [Frankia nepalensis]